MRGCGRESRTRPWPHAAGPGGYTLVEILFVLGLLAVLTGAAVPQLTTAVDRGRARAAARYLASRMILARTQAVSKGATVALRFDTQVAGIGIAAYVDGNHNGVRTLDIDAMIDRQLEPPVALADLFPGVAIGLSPLLPGTDPIQIGSTNLLSFTPNGTATSGSIYVLGKDGTQYVVRVLGATGRTRVLRYNALTRLWVEVL